MRIALAALAVVLMSGCGNTPAKSPTDTPATPGGPATAAGGGAPGKVDPASGTWSLEEKGYWEKLNEEMQGWLDDTNKGCDGKMSGAFGADSFKGKFKDGGSYGLSGYTRSSCQSAFSSVRDLCAESDTNKKAVQAKINRIVCEYGPAKMDLSGNVLTVTVDADEPNAKNASTVASDVTDFLKKKL